LPVILLLILWATRIAALEALPLHNDEALHLTRALEVWNGHPFWQIGDGKIVNHWPIAAFYPQQSPVFVGRVATVFVAMIGLAAGLKLVRRLVGYTAAILGASLWIASPYLFFYERLALSDAEAGALVVVTLLAAMRLAHSGCWRDAVLTGFALALAMLFKFTAAPFALMVVIIVLTLSRVPLRQRMLRLVLAGLTAALCFVPPLLYLLVRGQDFFGIALAWLGGGESGSALGAGFGENAARLWTQLMGFGLPLVSLLMLAGLIILAESRRVGRILVLSIVLPLLVMMYFGIEVLPRHYVVALPLALLLGGAGLALALDLVQSTRAHSILLRGIVAVCVVTAAPFMATAYAGPGSLPLPQEERSQYVTEHSGGFGLREAVRAFPQTIVRRDLPIIASMFPDSCKRANFYAVNGLVMMCPQLPGQAEIAAALDEQGAAYVLVDTPPAIGLDVTALDANATRVAVYPRPGETEQTATVSLWLVERTETVVALETACSPENADLPNYAPSNVTEFVRVQESRLVIGDADYPVRGVNYYPARYPWRRFLTRTDLDMVRFELDLLRDAGFNTLRLFLWNGALFACPDATLPVSDAFLRLDTIIHEAAARGFRLIITLNDLPDLDERPLYANPSHVQEQTRFIVERYRDEAAIMAWDLRNEGDIDYGTHSAFAARFARQEVLSWLSTTANPPFRLWILSAFITGGMPKGCAIGYRQSDRVRTSLFC
jgi:hypothetical protein